MGERILVDTDVIIELLKGNPKALDRLREFGIDRISISAITVMELFFGAFNKSELGQIKEDLAAFEILYVDEETSRCAVDLMERFSKSHHLKIPDAIIGATAITSKSKLFTYNRKDFKFMPGVVLV